MSTDVDTVREALREVLAVDRDRGFGDGRMVVVAAALDRLAAAEALTPTSLMDLHAEAVERAEAAEARAAECEQRRQADFEHANYIAASAEARVEELHRDADAAEAQRDTLAEALLTIVSVRHDSSSGDMRYAQEVARAALAAVAPTEATP